MAVLGSLIVRIGASTQQLEQGLRRADDQIGAAVGRFNRLASQIGLGLSVGAVAAFGRAAIKLANDMEQSEIAFTTMLGSAERASAFLRQLADFAARTPFEFADLERAAKRLMAMGFAAEQVIPIMTAVGNAAAGLGGGAEMVDRITRALGQMHAKGKVSAEEMMQLAEAGVPAWEILARTIGTSIPDAMDLARKGAIDSATAITAMIEGMNQRFPSMMEKQSKTMSGLLSTLRDEVSYVMRDIGKALVEGLNLRAGVEQLTGWVQRMRLIPATIEWVVATVRAGWHGLLMGMQMGLAGIMSAILAVGEALLRLPMPTWMHDNVAAGVERLKAGLADVAASAAENAQKMVEFGRRSYDAESAILKMMEQMRSGAAAVVETATTGATEAKESIIRITTALGGEITGTLKGGFGRGAAEGAGEVQRTITSLQEWAAANPLRVRVEYVHDRAPSGGGLVAVPAG